MSSGIYVHLGAFSSIFYYFFNTSGDQFHAHYINRLALGFSGHKNYVNQQQQLGQLWSPLFHDFSVLHLDPRVMGLNPG